MHRKIIKNLAYLKRKCSFSKFTIQFLLTMILISEVFLKYIKLLSYNYVSFHNDSTSRRSISCICSSSEKEVLLCNFWRFFSRRSIKYSQLTVIFTHTKEFNEGHDWKFWLRISKNSESEFKKTINIIMLSIVKKFNHSGYILR